MLVFHNKQKSGGHDLDHTFFVDVNHKPSNKRNEDHLLVFREVCEALWFVAVKQVVRRDRPFEVDCANQENQC